MTRDNALIVAKLAHKHIEKSMLDLTIEDDVIVYFSFDGSIQVDEHLFTEGEMDG